MRGNGDDGGRLEDWRVGSLATARTAEAEKLGSWEAEQRQRLCRYRCCSTSQLLSFPALSTSARKARLVCVFSSHPRVLASAVYVFTSHLRILASMLRRAQRALRRLDFLSGNSL